MSDPMGTFAPILVSAVAAPSPLADPQFHARWLSAGIPILGVLAMGFLGRFGGEDEGDDPVVHDGGVDETDFLDGGDFGDSDEDDIDEFDDEFGDGGQASADLEPQINQLEAEIDDISSTVSAVRGENEDVRESIEQIEDNVRKLLEVYDVVTQGANPFADGPADGTDGFVFDAGAGGTDDEPIGDALAGADEQPDPAESTDEVVDEAVEGDDGLSFEELKTELEQADDASVDDAETDKEHAEVEGTEDDEAPVAPAHGVEAGKPYISSIPDGYGADLVVGEWMEYLVRETSQAEALRALRYYRTVDWITDDVGASLQSILSGRYAGPEEALADGGHGSALSREHHLRSLEYISQLRAIDGGPDDGRRLRRSRTEGEDHGIQR